MMLDPVRVREMVTRAVHDDDDAVIGVFVQVIVDLNRVADALERLASSREKLPPTWGDRPRG